MKIKIGNILPALIEYFIEHKIAGDLAVILAVFTFGFFVSMGMLIPGIIFAYIFNFDIAWKHRSSFLKLLVPFLKTC